MFPTILDKNSNPRRFSSANDVEKCVSPPNPKNLFFFLFPWLGGCADPVFAHESSVNMRILGVQNVAFCYL